VFSTNSTTAVIIGGRVGPDDCINHPELLVNQICNSSFENCGFKAKVWTSGETQPEDIIVECPDFNGNKYNNIVKNWLNYQSSSSLTPEENYLYYNSCNSLARFYRDENLLLKDGIESEPIGNPKKAYLSLALYNNASPSIKMAYATQEFVNPLRSGLYVGKFRIAAHPLSLAEVESFMTVGLFLSRKKLVNLCSPPNSSINASVLGEIENGNICPTPVNPQIQINNDSKLRKFAWKTQPWQEQKNIFLLSGGERFVTLGAFHQYIPSAMSETINNPSYSNNSTSHPAPTQIQREQSVGQYQYLFDGIELYAVAFPPQPVTICRGQSVTIGPNIDYTSILGVSYAWAIIGNTTASVTVSPTQTTTYRLTITLDGVAHDLFYVVNVLDQLTADAGIDLEICASNGIVPLNGTQAGGVWTLNGTSISPVNGQYYFDPTSAGVQLGSSGNTLTYTVSTNGACLASDSKTIKVFGAYGRIVGNEDLCLGNSVDIQFDGKSSSLAVFNWTVTGSTNYSVSPSFNTSDPAPYNIYSLTPGEVGTISVGLTISDPEAPSQLNGCLMNINPLIIRTYPVSQNGSCCINGYFVNEGPNVVVNDAGLVGTNQRATLGKPGQVTEMLSVNGTVFSGEYLIKGPLVLKGASSTFTFKSGTILNFIGDNGVINSVVNKGPNSDIDRNYILADEGVTLILEGCTLKANCDEMWQGVILSPGSNLISFSGSNGRRNMFSGAISGILSTCKNNPQVNSFLQVSSTDFRNCMIGIGDYNRPVTSVSSSIQNCTFETNPNTMLHPFAVNEVVSPAPDPEGRYYGIAGLHFGSTTNSKVNSPSVSNCQFENLIFGVLSQGSELTMDKCNFDYCYRASISRSSLTGGFELPSIDNHFELSKLIIEVPSNPNPLPNPEKGYAPMSISSNAWNITANSAVFGIKAYSTSINLNQNVTVPDFGSYTYKIVGKSARPASKNAFGIWTQPYPFHGLSVSKNYFNKLDDAVYITRSFLDPSNTLEPLNFTDNLFEDNEVALHYQYMNPGFVVSPSNAVLNIQRNNFDGNRTSVNLQASNNDLGYFSTDLTLKCNRFDKGNASYNGMYYGLKLGINHRLYLDNLGGNFQIATGNKTPGANIWPIAGTPNREFKPCAAQDVEFECGSSSWHSPSNWTSVANESSTGISIFRYTNEFIGTVSANGVIKNPYLKRCYTDPNLNIPGFIPGPNDVHECQSGLPDNDVVFPYRMAIDSSNKTFTSTTGLSHDMDEDQNYIGQNIPNPGKDEVLIPFSLGSNVKTAKIILRELASSRTIGQISLSLEQKEVKLDLSQWPSGIYTYTLEANGAIIQTRKLVIVK
jgi:hypothetical protein